MESLKVDSNHFAANPALFPISTATAHKSKKKNDSDSPGWWETTTCFESEQFWTAMDKETNDLIKRKTWSATPNDKPLASVKQVALWDCAFKKRRLLNRTCRKHQARFSAHHNLQSISNQKIEKVKDTSAILTEKEIETQNINFKKHIKSFEDDGNKIN